jgi:hypothetical protein
MWSLWGAPRTKNVVFNSFLCNLGFWHLWTFKTLVSLELSFKLAHSCQEKPKLHTNSLNILYAVHDYFKHAAGHDIFLLDWRQVLSYDVSFLNIRIVVNSVINLVNKNLPRTALQICMFHFNYNFTIIVPNAFNYVKNVTTWEQCSVEL